ncbi:hypothetical protein KCU76_g86, partial [Aureobasidium melanogenum]
MTYSLSRIPGCVNLASATVLRLRKSEVGLRALNGFSGSAMLLDLFALSSFLTKPLSNLPKARYLASKLERSSLKTTGRKVLSLRKLGTCFPSCSSGKSLSLIFSGLSGGLEAASSITSSSLTSASFFSSSSSVSSCISWLLIRSGGIFSSSTVGGGWSSTASIFGVGSGISSIISSVGPHPSHQDSQTFLHRRLQTNHQCSPCGNLQYPDQHPRPGNASMGLSETITFGIDGSAQMIGGMASGGVGYMPFTLI